MSPRTARIAAAAGGAMALAAAALYVVRALRGKARATGTRRGPTAGRPLKLVRGGAGEG
jgi:hypothetical protein